MAEADGGEDAEGGGFGVVLEAGGEGYAGHSFFIVALAGNTLDCGRTVCGQLGDRQPFSP
jgi:hypothetical protein